MTDYQQQEKVKELTPRRHHRQAEFSKLGGPGYIWHTMGDMLATGNFRNTSAAIPCEPMPKALCICGWMHPPNPDYIDWRAREAAGEGRSEQMARWVSEGGAFHAEKGDLAFLESLVRLCVDGGVEVELHDVGRVARGFLYRVRTRGVEPLRSFVNGKYVEERYLEAYNYAGLAMYRPIDRRTLLGACYRFTREYVAEAAKERAKQDAKAAMLRGPGEPKAKTPAETEKKQKMAKQPWTSAADVDALVKKYDWKPKEAEKYADATSEPRHGSPDADGDKGDASAGGAGENADEAGERHVGNEPGDSENSKGD